MNRSSFRHVPAATCAALLSLLGFAGPVHADVALATDGVRYDAALQFTAERDESGNSTAFGTAVLSLTIADFIVDGGFFAPDSCSTGLVSVTCAPTQEFRANGFGTGKAFIAFSFSTANGSETGFYFFDTGALAATGAYAVLFGQGLPGINEQGEPGTFGSAGSGTLSVSRVSPPASGVPVPATLALMGLGALAIGGAIGRRP